MPLRTQGDCGLRVARLKDGLSKSESSGSFRAPRAGMYVRDARGAFRDTSSIWRKRSCVCGCRCRTSRPGRGAPRRTSGERCLRIMLFQMACGGLERARMIVEPRDAFLRLCKMGSRVRRAGAFLLLGLTSVSFGVRSHLSACPRCSRIDLRCTVPVQGCLLPAAAGRRLHLLDCERSTTAVVLPPGRCSDHLRDVPIEATSATEASPLHRPIHNEDGLSMALHRFEDGRTFLGDLRNALPGGAVLSPEVTKLEPWLDQDGGLKVWIAASDYSG